MKQKVVTLLGVAAILAAIVVVRAKFDESLLTDERQRAAEAAERDLEEAAQISEDAALAANAPEPEADRAPVSQDLAGFSEIPWPDEAPEVFHVKFETTAGPFVVASHQSWAPLGHARFFELCQDDFFNDSGFFRVVPGFVVQFGLASEPKLTAQYRSANLRDDPVRKSNQRGKITFATSGPNSRTTQLFINYGDNANLDGMGFSPFGEVVAGMENVEKINAEYGEQPRQDRITSQGTRYLRDEFPNLDFIKRAVLVEGSPAPAAEAPASETPAGGAAPTE
ncbi:MAG: peptidylprolyl isomerase [Candidatus Hydrogenedentes bacterium]|nr:peptidylprolyl isomerase [Candidatus Hydrogenedentota bacterium]